MEVTTIKINDIEYVKKSEVKTIELSNRVIVRCRNAGVHIGTLKNRDAIDTVLENANRLWKWEGAFTLSEVATKGVDRRNSKIASMVQSIILTTSDVCEIIPITEGVDLTECNNG